MKTYTLQQGCLNLIFFFFALCLYSNNAYETIIVIVVQIAHIVYVLMW